MTELDLVLAETTKNNRVCPMPDKWAALYRLLPNSRRSENGWQPALPLILGAWYETSDQAKAKRLREHIIWAEENNVLENVRKFLVELSEADWHHIGE
jgi:hypothetical protein